MHICSPTVEHFAPFSHISSVHYSITIHFFQLPVNFCRIQISGIQKSNTLLTSQSAGSSITPFILKTHKMHEGDLLQPLLTTLSENMLRKPVDLEKRKRSHLRGGNAQTVVIFWTTLVAHLKTKILPTVLHHHHLYILALFKSFTIHPFSI